MFNYSFQLLFLAVSAIASLILCVWVYMNNPRSATNRIFGALGATVSAWVVVMYLAQEAQTAGLALYLIRLTIFLAVPMNTLFFLLAYTLPNTVFNMEYKWRNALAVVTVLIMGLSLSPYVFEQVNMTNGIPTPVPGAGLAFFGLVSIFLNVGAVYILVKRLKVARGVLREQLRFVMLGILLMFGFIIFAIFIPVIFGDATFVPSAPAFTLVFLVMAAYAIIHHGLLDIRLVVARTISFLFANVLLAIFYGSVVYIFLMEAPLYLSGSTLYGASLLILAAALLSFEYLERWATVLSNHIFFKKDYDPEKLMDDLTRIMANTIDLHEITQRILHKLTEEMNISKGVFVVFDNHKISDIEGIGYPLDEIKKADLDIIFHTRWENQHLLFEEMEESPLKELFRGLDISFAVPISADGKDIAILLLGSKLSGDIYFDRDLRLLDLFAREAGIAIQNARSYEEIKLFNKELEARVEARTKDVMKLKDEFFFVAAHELRAPITAIRGFLELVEGANKKMPKDVVENLGQISYASEHLNNLVNDLLEIARSEANAMKLVTEPVDIVSLTDEIIKELAPIAKKDQIQIKQSSVGDFKVMADKSKVKEVLVNLISNAIKYNREGGLVLVQVVSVPGADKVFVEIRDNGYGIPLDQQDKIFDKFFRVTSENTNQVLGTGLGLFLTKMLVEKMGGGISFSSVCGEGGGTTFSFYLKKAE